MGGLTRSPPASSRAAGLAMLLAVSACDRAPAPPATPGARLEAAAVSAGLVVDPASAPVVGSWARDNGRVCVVPTADGGARIGALVDYGDRQGCAAAGTLDRRGERLRIAFGACRFDARFDGERISFPAGLPEACGALCTGRATMDALEVERLSTSASEAATLRTSNGQLLCAN